MTTFRARPVPVEAMVTEGVFSAAAGGVQELMYRKSRNVGMIGTAASLLGGVGLLSFGDGGLMDQAGRGAFLSGSAIAGFKLSEIVFPANGTAAALRRVQAQRPMTARTNQPLVNRVTGRPIAPRVGGQYRSGVAAGGPVVNRAQPYRPALAPGQRAPAQQRPATPQASLSGRNPMTNEEILFSRV